MKKFLFGSMIVLMLLSLTLTIASAGEGMEDPVLCVAGKWLYVTEPIGATAKVTVPKGTNVGDKYCKDNPPFPRIKTVNFGGDEGKMKLTVDPNGTKGTVIAKYGDSTQKKAFDGKSLVFEFKLKK